MNSLKEKLLNADMLLIDVDGVIGHVMPYAGVHATWEALAKTCFSPSYLSLFLQMAKGDTSLIIKKIAGAPEISLLEYFVYHSFYRCPLAWLETCPQKRVFPKAKEFLEKISTPELTKIMVSRNMDILIKPYRQYLQFDGLYSNKAKTEKMKGIAVLTGVQLEIPSSKKEITKKILADYPYKKRFIVIGQYKEDVGIVEAVQEKEDKEYLVSIGFNANKRYAPHADALVKNWGELEKMIQ